MESSMVQYLDHGREVGVYSFELCPDLPLLVTETPTTTIDPLSYVSIRHCGTLTLGQGPATEFFRVLGLAAPGRWTATRLENDRLTANFQGNPLWPLQILREYEHLSRLLGSCLSTSASAHACIIPMATTINTRLDELFARESRIAPAFRFRKLQEYQSAAGGMLSDVEYIDAFIDRGVFPISPITDKDSMHDWSYHFITLLFPEYLECIRRTLACIREQLSRFHGISNHAWNYFGHTLDEDGNLSAQLRTESMPYRDAIYRQMAITLDSATAKPVQLLMLRQRGVLDKCAQELTAAGVFLEGVTARTIQRVLFLEANADALIEVPPGEAADSPESLMPHMLGRLDALEQHARALIDDDLVSTREQAFKRCLSTVDGLLLPLVS